MGDDVTIVSPLMTDLEIRAAFLKLSQSITSKAYVVTSKVQAMTTQVNREVGHMCLIILALHIFLREFTRMNPSTFYGSKVDKDP